VHEEVVLPRHLAKRPDLADAGAWRGPTAAVMVNDTGATSGGLNQPRDEA
jgi:hypothetical protein